MVRILVFLAALMIAPVSAQAQVLQTQTQVEPASPPPPNEGEEARYRFHKVDEGHLRLDQRTGQVSLCSRQSTGWACLTVPDDRAAFDQEIARLQNENVALKKSLLERGLPLPGGVTSERPTARNGEGGARSPGHAEFDRMVTAMERIWRRLIDMLASMQKDRT